MATAWQVGVSLENGYWSLGGLSGGRSPGAASENSWQGTSSPPNIGADLSNTLVVAAAFSERVAVLFDDQAVDSVPIRHGARDYVALVVAEDVDLVDHERSTFKDGLSERAPWVLRLRALEISKSYQVSGRLFKAGSLGLITVEDESTSGLRGLCQEDGPNGLYFKKVWSTEALIQFDQRPTTAIDAHEVWFGSNGEAIKERPAYHFVGAVSSADEAPGSVDLAAESPELIEWLVGVLSTLASSGHQAIGIRVSSPLAGRSGIEVRSGASMQGIRDFETSEYHSEIYQLPDQWLAGLDQINVTQHGGGIVTTAVDDEALSAVYLDFLEQLVKSTPAQTALASITNASVTVFYDHDGVGRTVGAPDGTNS